MVCISRFKSPMAERGRSGDSITDTESFFMAAIGLTKRITCNDIEQQKPD
jgi:hypothetical protein